jgi:hypothetical protein
LFILIQANCKVLDSHYELWLAWSRFLNTMHVEMFHYSAMNDVLHDPTAY